MILTDAQKTIIESRTLSKAPVIIKREGRVGRLTLNAPKTLHALTTQMCRAMTAALLAWRDDEQVKAILIDHAPSTRGFCGGGDVMMLVDSVKSDDNGQAADEFFAAEYRLNALIQSYDKPIIALLDGIVMGGGVGISVHGTARIITERTIFAMPEAGIGLFPDVGGSWFLPRLHGGIGYWLALTGTRLKGRDVLAAGMGTHFIESSELEILTSEICVLGAAALDRLEAHAAPSFSAHQPQIDSIFTSAVFEDVINKLDHDHSDWAHDQLELMGKNSPLSMKVAHRQLHAGAQHQTFHDTMRMEYRIACRLVRAPDFQEGVRAVLLDRDDMPRWSPASVEQISDDMLDKIFAPLGDNELNFL